MHGDLTLWDLIDEPETFLPYRGALAAIPTPVMQRMVDLGDYVPAPRNTRQANGNERHTNNNPRDSGVHGSILCNSVGPLHSAPVIQSTHHDLVNVVHMEHIPNGDGAERDLVLPRNGLVPLHGRFDPFGCNGAVEGILDENDFMEDI